MATPRAVVLTGAGRAFSAGGSIDEFEYYRTDFGARRKTLRNARRLVEDMLNLHLPVVAAVNGPAVGLGCTLATLCDIVFIDESTFLADPHVTVALVAGDGSAVTWPFMTSMLRVKQYLLTGDRIPAAVAVELGLANFAVAGDVATRRRNRVRAAAGCTAAAGRAGHEAGAQPGAAPGGGDRARAMASRPRASRTTPTSTAPSPSSSAPARPERGRMDFRFTAEEDAFRDEVQTWFAEHLVGDYAKHLGVGSATDPSEWELRREWERELASARLLNITWPTEYGGRGGTLNEEVIFLMEFARVRAPYWVGVHGRDLFGPTLLRHGTPEQKARFLPKITAVEELWGQGFSEPDAGSDLAGLRHSRDTRRRRVGDRRPEDLDDLRDVRRLALRAVPDRPRRSEAPRHLADHGAGGPARRRHPPDPQHGRRRGVLRGVPHRSADARPISSSAR